MLGLIVELFFLVLVLVYVEKQKIIINTHYHCDHIILVKLSHSMLININTALPF